MGGEEKRKQKKKPELPERRETAIGPLSRPTPHSHRVRKEIKAEMASLVEGLTWGSSEYRHGHRPVCALVRARCSVRLPQSYPTRRLAFTLIWSQQSLA